MHGRMMAWRLFAILAMTGAIVHAQTPPAAGQSRGTHGPMPAKADIGNEENASIPTSRAPQVHNTKPDHAVSARNVSKSGERFPATPVGRALDQHLLTLVDVSDGADERKARSLETLRKDSKEVSQDLMTAYRKANPGDYFGRWLLSLTLADLRSGDAYAGLRSIALSPVRGNLKDSDDLAGSPLANESAIRQNAVEGLAQLARAGNAAAQKDLLGLAVKPPSGDDALRVAAIKGYLAAGRDYDARVRTLKAKVPVRYYDVVTLAVAPLDEVSPPAVVASRPKAGG